MAFDPNEVQAYIRQQAAALGIDPGTALRVFKQESSFNPEARNISPKEESYGVAQLNAMGGLGAVALKQGINIRDPNTWRQQLDFALNTVKRDGWRQWYGARDVGIGRWDGINGRAPAAPAPVKGSAAPAAGSLGRMMSPTPIAQQAGATGPAPAVFGDVVAARPVETVAVAPTLGDLMAQQIQQRQAQAAVRAEERSAEQARRTALLDGNLFGIYG
jgi:hypothetical protein